MAVPPQVFSRIDVATQKGLEIGPLANPIVRPEMGNIYYIDRASTEELRRLYSNDSKVDVSRIPHVHYVWRDRPLKECVEGDSFDYVIASHVLEHVPDLVGYLQQIAEILHEGGILSLVLPDKRFTFDLRRQVTDLADVLGAYARALRKPDARQIFDHFLNFAHADGTALWHHAASPADYPPARTPAEIMKVVLPALERGDYVDSHCWVFTPSSLLELLGGIAQAGELPFLVADFTPTAFGENQFLISLRKAGREEAMSGFAASMAAPLQAALAAERAYDEAAARRQPVVPAPASAAEAELAAIKASRSWRITAPLRAVATALKGSA